MFRKKDQQPQQGLWVATSEIVTTPANAFLVKFDAALASLGFGESVRALCAPFYEMDASKGGRPGIDPEVYFKMLLVGFFEGIGSERGIAARCADSLSIRQFLGYDLWETTPDHSSLTVIRQRLGAEVYRQVFDLVLVGLDKHKLLKGRNVGIDASTLEANAAKKKLENRLTGQDYSEYVKGLAAEAGVDAEDAAAVRSFDRKRPGRTTSNKDWKNPHDPDAKIGKTKRGAVRMIYKPEHIVDLETGAILDADVRPGDEADTDDLSTRVSEAEARLKKALGIERSLFKVITSDKGYYKLDEVAAMQAAGLRTVIPDPISNRRPEKLPAKQRQVLRSARRAVTAHYGKSLMKRRGMFIERSFEHLLDCGGARRTTLRGRINIKKRYLVQAMGVNLSLLMRRLIGIGTPKQALAAAERLVFAPIVWLEMLLRISRRWMTDDGRHGSSLFTSLWRASLTLADPRLFVFAR
jgi:transposase